MANLVPQEEPFPWRGLNDAVSPVNMEPGYTPSAHDVVLDEPGAIRPRYGWRRYYPLTSAPTFGRMIPVGYLRNNLTQSQQQLFTHLIQLTDNNLYTAPYGDGPDGTDLTARAYVLPGGALQADGSTYRRMLPYGHPTWYLDNDYSVSVGRFSRFTSNSNTATVTDSAVVTWSGNDAAVQTRTLTINNGSRTGTLSSAITGSTTGLFMVVTDVTAGDASGHRYLYEVDPNLTSGTTLYLTENYGLGDTTSDVPNITTKTVTFYPIGYIPNAPAATAVASWKERLWAVGRSYNHPPTKTGDAYVEPVLAWSEVADPNRWPAANYIQLDASFKVTAMAATRDALYVFTPNQTLVVSGTDESNFQLDVAFDSIGCIHKGGCFVHMDTVYVMSGDGVYRIGSDGVQNLTKQSQTAGVNATYRQLLTGTGTLGGSFTYDSLPWLMVHRDHLYLTMDQHLGPTYDPTYLTIRPLPMAMNLSTGSWTTWGKTATRSRNPSLIYRDRVDITAADPTPEDKLFGAGRTGYFYMDPCWDVEPIVSAMSGQPFSDECYSSATTSVDVPVESTFTTRDFMFADGQTTRVQSIQVEHGCQAPTSNVLPWTVTLDYDQDIDAAALTVGSVRARLNASVSRSKYYTDNFTDVAFPTEGMVFRTKYTFAATAVYSAKLYRQRFHVLRSPTKSGRVDNT